MARKEEERRAPRVDDDLLTECGAVDDEAEVTDAMVQGDFAGSELHLVAFRQCRVESATFTASRLTRAAFVDCVVVDSDLSGVLLEDGRLERVEFLRCRLSGLQAPKSQFTDVAFVDCKADAAAFRMTTWERAEFRDCNLVESDFYGAKLPGSRIQGCDLTRADFSKADLTRSRLQRSNLTDLRGGDALRGVTLGSDQLIPAALALFAVMKIHIDDE
jgi:uncharacterized protein YjbI with pentapeptide repeats